MVLEQEIASLLQFFPPVVIVFFISMMPVLEHLVAIPLGILYFNLPWWQVYVLSIAGNMVPMPVILRYLGDVERVLRKYHLWDRFFTFIYARAFRRAESRMNKYKTPILITFIAIPLPLTGGWSGVLTAFLFDVEFWTALVLILIGLMISGALVTILVLFLPGYLVA